MKVKDFMQEHANERVHLHWEGFDPKTKCIGFDAYSTNQDLAETHGEDEIGEWEYRTEWHYDRNWNKVPMQVTFVKIAKPA